MNNPLAQDLATVNMLMTALNLTKDQATAAITEALNEGDDDKATDISRFQHFPNNFEQFLEANDIPFPTQNEHWEAFSNSFKEHAAGIARHVDFKINPARKYRLGHRAIGQPRAPPRGKLMSSETVTSPTSIFCLLAPSSRPFSEIGLQPGTTGLWNRDITFQPLGQLDPRMGTLSPYYARRPRTRPCTTCMSQRQNPST